MERTFLFLLADACLVAVIMEGIKKVLGHDVNGRWKTALTKSTIITVAAVLSVLVALITYLGDVLVGNEYMLLLYAAIIFAGQWFLDMQVVKKLIDALIEKVTRRG